MHRLFLLWWSIASWSTAASGLPALNFESPPELAAVRTRLESIPPRRFGDIAEFLGVTDVGPAIRVILATENSELARRVAPWISGFAIGESSLVVVFPGRSPGYPDNTLEDVLRHEIAHVLIWRAAGTNRYRAGSMKDLQWKSNASGVSKTRRNSSIN